MSLTPDVIMERTRLKSALRRWRVLFILAVMAVAYLLLPAGGDKIGTTSKVLNTPYVARVDIDGIIFENQTQKERLEALAYDTNAKAVIVYINSPGGTLAGSQILYQSLMRIAQKKPVVTVIGSMGASGGYMVALAGEHIFAQPGSLTGSIGVMLQTAEVTELAKKIGVEMHTFKSSPLKGEPSPFTKMTPEVAASVETSLKDSYLQFIEMVQQRRKLPKNAFATAVDGRIFTGRQAKEAGLIDDYGDEVDALNWLKKEGKISKHLKIQPYPLFSPESSLQMLLSIFSGKRDVRSAFSHDGLMTLWNPSLM